MLRARSGRLRVVLITLLVSHWPLPSVAGDYIVLGAGTRNCVAVLEAYEEDSWQRVMDSVWVSGYLTAVNEHTTLATNVSATMTAPEREHWLADYCQSNAGDTLHNAAGALLHYLLKGTANGR